MEPANLSSVVHVALVAEDHLFHVGARVLLNVADPVFDVVKGLLVAENKIGKVNRQMFGFLVQFREVILSS